MATPQRDHEVRGVEPGDGADVSPHLSEWQRTLRAVALGAALGLVLLMFGRRRSR